MSALPVMTTTGVDELVERIACRVVELLEQSAANRDRLLTAAEVAGRLGVDRSFVYEHAVELGAIRLGEGSKGRLRFRWERVLEALEPDVPGSQGRGSRSAQPQSQPRPRRRRRPANVELLPVHGEPLPIQPGRKVA